MEKLVECVPNFSEGRDKTKIKAITDAISKIKGVELLDVDPGEATNRTVVTLAGEPESIVNGAFEGIKKAAEVIDMSTHKGAHARQGATDVCPFIPISGVSEEECIEIAKRLAEKVGKELDIPVYLYGKAATRPEREKLPDIRKGEYEALEEKLKQSEWKPDFGPAKFNPGAGATVIGVRNFLIAYNVNLNTKNVKIAKEIGFNIREKGRAKRDTQGKRVRDKDGKLVRRPGILKHTQAAGWFIEEYDRAQVTINILNHIETPIHKVFDTVCDQAEKLGARVTGSELVGLIPKEAMLEAGRHYLQKQNLSRAQSEVELIEAAVLAMGLNELTPFDIDKKIIEYNFKSSVNLTGMKVGEFTNEMASNSPAPGGGSVAALSGALSSALTAMVTNLTFNKKGYKDKNELMEFTGIDSQKLKKEMLDIVNRDTEAFNNVMAAMKLPKKSEEDKNRRKKIIQDANKEATLVPFSVLEKSVPALKLASVVERFGNQNSLSDSGVAALMARAAAYGAYYNVLINLQGIDDRPWCDDIKQRADKLLTAVDEQAGKIEKSVMDKLS